MRNSNQIVNSLKAGSALVSLAILCAGSPAAFARTDAVNPGKQGAGEQNAGEQEAILVTGSRIQRDGYDQPTPVTVMTAEALQNSQPSTLADALNELPQLGGGRSRTFCCEVGTVGNYLNLRSLGTNRTLVLLDGQRVVPTRESGDVDVNLLPELLVERVDLVTGGASAAYGSDAVSGVVNYVIDKKFTGFKVNVQGGISNYGDDQSFRVGVAGGASFADGRGHFVIGVEHYKTNGIESLNDRPSSNNGHFMGGNGTAASPYVALNGVRQNTATYGGVIVNAGGLPFSDPTAPLAGLRFLPNGSTAPFAFGTAIPGSPAYTIGGDGIENNLAQPAGSLRTEKLYARLSYDVSDGITAFVRVNAGQSKNQMRVLADNRQRGTAFTIFDDNAYLSQAMRDAMATAGVSSFRMGRFNRDFGAVTLDYDNRMFDINVGLNGTIAGNWKWTAQYSHGETKMNGNVENDADIGKLYAAADAVVDPATHKVVCRVTLTNPGVFPGCVPINLFGEGAPSAAALDYVLGTSTQVVKNTQSVAAFEVSGDLVQLPAGALAIAFGGEYRERTLVERSNQVALNQINAQGVRGMPGALCPTVSTCRFGGWNQGNFGEADARDNVKEGFIEAVIPVLKSQPLAETLEFNGAYRYTHYQNSGGVSTWKLGLTYAPFEDLRFRVARSRDIRAPNLYEMFAGPVNAFEPGIVDPVTGESNLIIITRNQGNPNLQPERADTLTLGGVYTPSWARGLSLSVDYYRIRIRGALSATTAQGTIDGCFGGNTQDCSLITRDAVTKDIQQVILQQVNLDSRTASGIDFDLSYRTAIGKGALSLRALVTRTIDYTDTSGGVSTQIAGFYDASTNTTLPKWRGTLSATYEHGPLTLFVQERMIGGYEQMPFIPGQVFAKPNVEAVFYTDLTASYDFNMVGGNFEMFATVTNLFNRKPPFVPNRYSAALAFPTTSLALYDVDNRYFTVGLRAKF